MEEKGVVGLNDGWDVGARRSQCRLILHVVISMSMRNAFLVRLIE